MAINPLCIKKLLEDLSKPLHSTVMPLILRYSVHLTIYQWSWLRHLAVLVVLVSVFADAPCTRK